MRAARFLPALIWTLCIAWFSTERWAAARTEVEVAGWLGLLLPWLSPDAVAVGHWLLRKSAHAVEYALLALLWSYGLEGWRRPLALVVATAFLDEAHQSTTMLREGSAADVLVDAVGAGLALGVLRGGLAATAALAGTALLWVAAIGGTAMLAVHALAGVDSHWLWLTTPAAWALLGWDWHRRRATTAPGAARP